MNISWTVVSCVLAKKKLCAESIKWLDDYEYDYDEESARKQFYFVADDGACTTGSIRLSEFRGMRWETFRKARQVNVTLSVLVRRCPTVMSINFHAIRSVTANAVDMNLFVCNADARARSLDDTRSRFILFM